MCFSQKLIVLLFCCMVGTLSAEKPIVSVDVIKEKLKRSTVQSDKEKFLEQIIASYLTTDIDSALYYSDIYRSTFVETEAGIYECNYYNLLSRIYKEQHNLILFQEQSSKALECYTSHNDSENIAKSHVELGIAYAYQGKIKEAVKNFEEAKSMFIDQKDSLSAAECAMHLGTTNIMQGEKDNGLADYFEVLNYYEKIGHEEELGKLCNNIGLVYLSLNQPTDALHYFQKGLAYSEKSEDLFVTSQILANIAGCYKENKEYNIALGYLSKGLTIAEEINSAYSQAVFYQEIAATKFHLDQDYESLDAVNNSLELFEKMNNIDEIANTLVLKSNILLDLSNYQAAHESCKKCYQISKKTQTLEVQKRALDCISKTSNALKIYREAYEYQKEYITVSDSLQRISSREKLAATEKRNQYQKEKALLEQKNLLNESLLREEKNNTKIFALLSIVSLLGLGFLAFVYRSGKKYTSRIKEKTVVIEKNNQELSKLNKELGNANTKLNNFTSVAAHDLKSPIRTIASYSGLLMMRNKDKMDPKDLEMLGFVSQNAKQLTEMIDDLLAFSKINDDLGPAEVVDVNKVVQIVTNNLGAKIAEEKVMIQTNGDLLKVRAHTNLLTQLFQNLISNGIKFRKVDQLSKIVIRRESVEEDRITYSISDNGIGIEPKYFEKIFTIFQRLHNKDSYEGSGIGLATCKSIIDYYDQKIWLESEVGKGTSFFFSLPKA